MALEGDVDQLQIKDCCMKDSFSPVERWGERKDGHHLPFCASSWYIIMNMDHMLFKKINAFQEKERIEEIHKNTIHITQRNYKL